MLSILIKKNTYELELDYKKSVCDERSNAPKK